MNRKDILNFLHKEKFSIIIPVYNHENTIADVVEASKRFLIPVIIVDDGSTDTSYERIRNIDGITIIKHEINKGKGSALKTGFQEASAYARWSITIDADGQHNPEDIIFFATFFKDNNLIQGEKNRRLVNRPILIGMRKNMTTGDIPWTSRFGRKFSNFWVYLSSGIKISDTQSGFRVYPVPETLNLNTKSDRFQFEVEVLVKAVWKGIPVYEVPVHVSYPPGKERISHFRPFLDFLRNSSTFTRLIIQRIFIPSFIRRRID